MLWKIPIIYGIFHYHVIATIAIYTCLNTLCNYSAVCGTYASHTWIKPNRIVSAPSLMLIQIIMGILDIAQQYIMLIAMFVSIQYHTQHALRPNRDIYKYIDSQQR